MEKGKKKKPTKGEKIWESRKREARYTKLRQGEYSAKQVFLEDSSKDRQRAATIEIYQVGN